jgi:uridylate kinase
MQDEKIVISLGGSLIVPDEVDVNFLNIFKNTINSFVEKGKKFVIIAGGGKLCRRYQDSAMAISDLNPEELDWLGIYSTRFNAQFLKFVFGKNAKEEIITDPNFEITFNKSIILGGGWKPGNSTDLVAITIAEKIGVKKIINLSNTDYVYDSDPKYNENAKKIENISWADYRKIIPENWNPGLNSPFDPVASKLAEEKGISVITMNGKNINNLVNFLEGKEFQGTIIG